MKYSSQIFGVDSCRGDVNIDLQSWVGMRKILCLFCLTGSKHHNSPHHCPVLGFWVKCRWREFEDVLTVQRVTHPNSNNTSSSTSLCPFSLYIIFSEVTAKKNHIIVSSRHFFQVPLKSIPFCPLASSIIHKYFVVVIFYIKNFQTPLNYQLQSHLIACLQHQKAKEMNHLFIYKPSLHSTSKLCRFKNNFPNTPKFKTRMFITQSSQRFPGNWGIFPFECDILVIQRPANGVFWGRKDEG